MELLTIYLERSCYGIKTSEISPKRLCAKTGEKTEPQSKQQAPYNYIRNAQYRFKSYQNNTNSNEQFLTVWQQLIL